MLIARNLGRAGESWWIVTLAALGDTDVDMLTIVIVGNSETRVVARRSAAALYAARI